MFTLLTKLFSLFGTDKKYYIGSAETSNWNKRARNRNNF